MDTENHTETTPGEPWNLWLTAAFSFMILIIFVIVQTLIMTLFIIVEYVRGNIPDLDIVQMEALVENGLLLALATIGSTIVCVPLILFFTWLRKGISLRAYLGFRPIPRSSLLLWLGVIILFAVLWDAMTLLLDRPVVPDFVENAYTSAGFLPLLWLAVIVGAPLFEELFFRGFLFEGIRFSKLGPIGAVLITSGIWAAIHLQYQIYELASIFFLGLVLGAARLKTRSIITPMAMHALVNLIATIEVTMLLNS